jgi:lysophosphatidic acid acyltransferase / lysophosphatidylinositol acyltransferase
MMEFWSRSQITFYTKGKSFSEIQNSFNLVVANHSSEIDFMIAPSWADRMNLLSSSLAFIKKNLLYFPIFGQLGFFYRFIFLDRSFEKDELKIKQQLKEYITFKKTGISLIYPEGTRFTKQKHQDCIKLCQRKNLPIFKYHLTPRTKGFKTCVEVMKKMNENCCLLNLNCEFKGGEPTLVNILRGKKLDIHIFIESIAIENVEATDEWLFNLFQMKDELHASFVEFGNFHEFKNEAPFNKFVIEPNSKVLINYLFWMVITIMSCFWLTKWMVANNYALILFGILTSCE